MREREGGELGKSGDGVAQGKVDVGRIVRKWEFGGESFAGSRRELEGGEIGDGGWGISSERGCRGKSGMGRGSEIGKEDEAADFERGEEESGSAGRQGEGKSWMQRRMGKRGKGGRIAGKQEIGGGASREVELEGDRKWGKSGGSWRGCSRGGRWGIGMNGEVTEGERWSRRGKSGGSWRGYAAGEEDDESG